MKRAVSIGMAALLAATSIVIAPAADARPGVKRGHHAAHGPVRRRGRGGDVAAAAAVAGVAGALIGGAIASSQRRRMYDDGYYDAPYGYGPAPYGYYGY